MDVVYLSETKEVKKLNKVNFRRTGQSKLHLVSAKGKKKKEMNFF